MASTGRDRQWPAGPDGFPWQQLARRSGWTGPLPGGLPGGFPGIGTPPPWMAGLFGVGRPERQRGAQVRRGDVRAAIIDVLATARREEDRINGYQVIGRIDARSGGAWRPSPGSVYPTIAQLEDEGLVESDEERGRRTIGLTAAGVIYAEEHADELAAVWAPFEQAAAEAGRHAEEGSGQGGSFADLKPELGALMSAVWQIVTSGTDAQRRAAIDILIETRRRLYGVLADEPDDGDAPSSR